MHTVSAAFVIIILNLQISQNLSGALIPFVTPAAGKEQHNPQNQKNEVVSYGAAHYKFIL
jgi:hypothetical protein